MVVAGTDADAATELDALYRRLTGHEEDRRALLEECWAREGGVEPEEGKEGRAKGKELEEKQLPGVGEEEVVEEEKMDGAAPPLQHYRVLERHAVLALDAGDPNLAVRILATNPWHVSSLSLCGRWA